jgi:hypothetical protein
MTLKKELLAQSSETDIEVLLKAKMRNSISSEVNGSRSRDLTSFNMNQIA